MRKILVLMMVMIMLLTIVACNAKTETATSVETTENHESATATTDTTEETIEEENNTVPETWVKSFYVDDFDEPTDEWFITSVFSGVFSNSATTDSNLTGCVLIDAEYVSFILYEYNRNQVKNTYSHNKAYTITAKAEDGTQTEFCGSVWSQGDRVIVSDADKPRILELLKNGGKIKFYIYETDNSVTNYLFTIESDNLKDLLP